jgi:hypothetical protein
MQFKDASIPILVATLALGAGTSTGIRASRPQGGSGSQDATGIAECDQYYAMVAACLPRMCEAERLLVELELSLTREMLPKVVERRGREAAAQGCAKDILKEIEDDPYGCYESQRAKAGMPQPGIRNVRIRPAATNVTISFQSSAAATGDGGSATSAGRWEVAISSELLETEARYELAGRDGEFVLNTASEQPVALPAGAAAAARAPLPPIELEPDASYCFVIRSPAGEERRGTFATAAER